MQSHTVCSAAVKQQHLHCWQALPWVSMRCVMWR